MTSSIRSQIVFLMLKRVLKRYTGTRKRRREIPDRHLGTADLCLPLGRMVRKPRDSATDPVCGLLDVL